MQYTAHWPMLLRSELFTSSNVFHSLLPLSLPLSLSTRDNYRTNDGATERKNERTRRLTEADWVTPHRRRVLHSSRRFSWGTATTLQGCVLVKEAAVPVIIVVVQVLAPFLITRMMTPKPPDHRAIVNYQWSSSSRQQWIKWTSVN